MKAALSTIANIRTGIFAKSVSNGEIVYLQSKHFDINGNLNATLHPDLKRDKNTENHLLQHGDVLFASKGTKNFATWYENNNAPAVASTSFFVISTQEGFRNKIIPEYLVWYINQPSSQQFLKGKAIGTAIVSISKTALESLEISIPDIKTQKAILKISELRNREKKIKFEIETFREIQIQQQITNAIK